MNWNSGSDPPMELTAKPRVDALVRAVAKDVCLEALPQPTRQMLCPLVQKGRVLFQLRVSDITQEDKSAVSSG